MTLALIADIASWALIVTGSLSLVISTLGLLRLPDFYTRIHAAGVTDTIGAELVVFGLVIQAGLSLVSVKLLLIGLFLFFTSPTATHAVTNAAFMAGLKPRLAKESKEKDVRGEPVA
jgi:multicomponent Na+:H+ antiporter subunit G